MDSPIKHSKNHNAIITSITFAQRHLKIQIYRQKEMS
jgi:hypothetical protein